MCFKKRATDSTDKITINPLTPEAIRDKDSHSYKTVREISAAIDHKDVRNIAVTGPYGSGKSSILKTLMEDFNENRQYLSISLATLKSGFKDKEDNKENSEQKPANTPGPAADASKENEELNRKIEYSIVQQLIYRESTDDLPNSRIKKIVHTKPIELFWKPLACIGFILALWKLFSPTCLIIDTLIKEIPERSEIFIDAFCLVYVLTFLYCCIRGLIKSYSNSKLNKLNLKDGEIEIKENSSIFNKHLDEIIYFFQATKYNVVIIEDLDRYETTDIFLKLRELNLILNNAHSTVGRKITFIYAIRDDMFKDTDRTKFFDYISTVIPVINYSNSKEKLTEALRTKGYSVGIGCDFEVLEIEEIAFFIDDMRLLKNIVNEFHQYWEKLGKNGNNNQLNPAKLLAMITYKNFFPEEFVKLHRRKGRVYDCISKKKDFINFVSENLNESIKALNKERDALVKTIHVNQNELRSIYAEKVRKKLADYSIAYLDDKRESIDTLLNDLASFNKIWANGYIECESPSYYRHKTRVDLDTHQIENTINPQHSYLERLAALENGFEHIRMSEFNIEAERFHIRSLSIRELCHRFNINDCTEYSNCHLKPIEAFFITNGYIGEDYYDYISYFYDDLISPSDHDFILASKINKPVKYDYHLDKPQEVVKEMGLPLFRSLSVINFDLVNYLVSDEENAEKLNVLIETIKRSPAKEDFLEEYYNNTANPFDFFVKLYNEHKDWFWNHCISRSNSGNSSLMVAYFRVCDKDTMTPDETQWLNDHFDLVETLHSQMGISDFNGLIKDCRFVKINNKRADLLDYIISNKLYQINTDNLVVIANHLGHAPISADELTLTRILGLSNREVSDYILENLGNCIAQLPGKTKNESSESLLLILNDESIDENQKCKYLSQQENDINDLSDIKTIEMTNLAIELDLVAGAWSNANKYYNAYEWNGSLIAYINKRASEIGETAINVCENADLINHVLANIPASSLQHLSGSLKTYDFNNLENVEKFDADNIERILDCNFSTAQIRTIINRCERNVILESSKIGNTVVREYLKESWDLDVEKLIVASNSISDIETKLKLFASIIMRADIEDSYVTLLINILPEEYHQLGEKGKRVKLEVTEHNMLLAESLKARGYISKYTTKGDKIQLNTKRG